ncbi:hypothetical protein D9758_016051 [Tetrapyrgos nigripes]|uniref:AB hydrolase-1 domain-containing protein n=1 Tax=Tetrapyrgos nigripes TaxID=182062 RepID=A0A8H5FGU2_9AGAR|nr:hypothetical protein D9758_016051 [Tetrapyrgos nigripes]
MDFSVSSLSTACLAVVCASLTFRLFLSRSSSKFPLPPGPKRSPLIGNLRDLNKIDKPLWLQYSDWAKTYGDIFYLEVFGAPMVVLNTAKAIDDLFEKRSANFSDRPPMYMVNELMGWAWDFAHMKYSDWWRLHRKTFHQYFQPRQLPEFYPIQRESATMFLRKLLDDPEDFRDHVRHHAGSIILKVVYGHNMKFKNDHYVELADQAVRGLSEAIAHGSFLVDFVPALSYIPSWFPGATFKKKAELWAHDSKETRDGPWVDLKKSFDNGTGIPCFAIDSLEKFKNSKHMEEVIKNCSGVAFVAGADTASILTVSTISSAILALLLHPEVQTKAQEEIDRVVGRSRLPDFDDRENMPYLEAILTESLRWNPVLPLSLPHRSMNDDIYEGLFIPGGSTIVGNAWNILHDPEAYPDPFTFNPERFLPKDDQELPPDPSLYAFGFGRRICPGRYLALNSAWIAIASLMATCRLTKPIDKETKKEIEPVVDYSEGIVCHPAPFKCCFTPRSPEALKLMQAGYLRQKDFHFSPSPQPPPSQSSTMRPFILTSFSALALSFISQSVAQTTSLSYTCSEFFVPVNVSASTVQLNLTAPKDQTELTGILNELSWANSTFAKDVTIGPTTLNKNYKIWSKLCIPNDFPADGVVEFAIHASAINHTYWNYANGTGSDYAEAALKSGHAIFMYDQIGEGNSDKPDGIQEVQIGTEIAVASALIDNLPSLLKFGKIVGVAHAHGSVVMIALIAERGNIFDATVLTTISVATVGTAAGLAALNIQIASQAAPEMWSSIKDTSYTVSAGPTNDQIAYYFYPFFDEKVLLEVQQGRGLLSLGILLTLPTNSVAQNYTHPVFVVTGEHDFFMCAGQCNVPQGNFPSLPAAVQSLFPSASKFDVDIVENTGHFIFMHNSGPDVINSIQTWIEQAL